MIKLAAEPIIAKNKKSNSWYFRIKYYDDERLIDKRKQGFSTKKEAKLAAAEFETGLFQSTITENGSIKIDSKAKKEFATACETTENEKLSDNFPKGILVKDLYEEYVKYISSRLKAGSVRSASDVLRLFVLPDFGDREVESLTPQDIREWQERIIAKGFGYKYKAKIYCGFTAMLNYGIKFHDLRENVVSRVGNFKNTDRKKEMLFWTEEEFKQFYAAIDDDLYRVYFSFLYLTGCRKGESLALTWNDIDFVRKEVRINKSLNRKQKSQGVKEQTSIPLASSDIGWHISASRSYEITTPKNKSSYRNVLMPMNLVKMLWEHQKRCKEEYGYRPDWFVFGGEEPLSDQTIRRRLNEYADKAGVKRIRVHDIRHSHASLLINKGQNILIVSQRLGHSDVTQTLNTYSHLMPNVQRQIINALDFEM